MRDCRHRSVGHYQKLEPTESACGDDDDVLLGRHLFKFIQIQMIADTDTPSKRKVAGIAMSQGGRGNEEA